jgi:hypothetical protein
LVVTQCTANGLGGQYRNFPAALGFIEAILKLLHLPTIPRTVRQDMQLVLLHIFDSHDIEALFCAIPVALTQPGRDLVGAFHRFDTFSQPPLKSTMIELWVAEALLILCQSDVPVVPIDFCKVTRLLPLSTFRQPISRKRDMVRSTLALDAGRYGNGPVPGMLLLHWQNGTSHSRL